MPQIKSELSNRTMPVNKFKEVSIPDESGSQTSRTVSGDINIDFDAVDALMKERGMPPVDRNAMQSQYNMQQQAKRGGMSNQDMLDYEQQIKEAKQAKVTGRERLSSGAKQRIEMLCGISRMRREVDIDNNKFVLQTLRGKDQREIWVAAAEFQNTVEFPFELRKQTLARALVQVAETDIELFLNSNLMEAKLDFVDLQDEEVLNKLYTEFNKLVDESKSKYSIKSDKDAAAVVEDLKK